MKFEICPKSTETILNWQDAILYCSMLDIDGFGWRLPTLDELDKIYKMDNDFEKRCYWTCTEKNGTNAWIQVFDNGSQFNCDKINSGYIRAVRPII